MAEVETPPCDPCQWPVVDGATQKQRPCGWREGVNIRPHLKSHVKRDGKKLTLAQYKKRFPKANLGPAFIPSQEHVQKFLKKGTEPPAVSATPPGPPETSAPSKPSNANNSSIYDPDEEKIKQRVDELMRMVSYDPAARSFCVQAAREEDRNEQLNKQLDDEMQKRAPDRETLKVLRQAIGDSVKMLQGIFSHLALTVKDRRKENQLGDTSTVSQLISNYANTRRKWSPARNAIFESQMAEVRARMEERIQRRLISEAPTTLVEQGTKQELKTDDDYNTAISSIGEYVRAI